MELLTVETAMSESDPTIRMVPTKITQITEEHHGILHDSLTHFGDTISRCEASVSSCFLAYCFPWDKDPPRTHCNICRPTLKFSPILASAPISRLITSALRSWRRVSAMRWSLTSSRS